MRKIGTRIGGGLLALGLAVLAAGCVTPETRIQNNPGIYAALPPEQQGLVRQGMIMEGMSKDAVYLAWGTPDRYSESHQDGRKRVSWLYVGYRSEEVPGYSWAPYRGRYCDPYYDLPVYRPTYVQVPYLYRKVTFENGRVVAFEAPVRGRL